MCENVTMGTVLLSWFYIFKKSDKRTVPTVTKKPSACLLQNLVPGTINIV
jgi:hypothetical protein